MKTSLALIAVFLTACSNSDGAYTLYRNSVLNPNMRLHVASFDSSDGDQYNRENCLVAAQLFLQQPGLGTRFWCEKGPYKK